MSLVTEELKKTNGNQSTGLVTVYTSPDCRRCESVKAWLKKHGIDFEEKVVGLHDRWRDDDTVDNMAEFMMVTANRSDVPALVIDGVVLQPIEAVNTFARQLETAVGDVCEDGVCRV